MTFCRSGVRQGAAALEQRQRRLADSRFGVVGQRLPLVERQSRELAPSPASTRPQEWGPRQSGRVSDKLVAGRPRTGVSLR